VNSASAPSACTTGAITLSASAAIIERIISLHLAPPG
jgi:hypothetical protein